MRPRYALFLSTMLIISFCYAQQERDIENRKWLAAFLEAFNTGDSATISAFASEHSGDPAYARALFREVGGLDYKVEYEGAFWCQGNDSKAWVGLVLRQNEEGPYLSGVRRGIRPPNAPLPDPMNEEQWKSYLIDFLRTSEEQGHFSGTVLVAKGDDIIFEGAYGWADVENAARIEPETMINLASVTKMFTGVAIAQLAESGKLSFQDPISKYIPEFPPHISDQVTIHHLLTHTSGIELDNYGPYNDAVANARSLDDLLAAQVKHIQHLNSGNYDDFKTLERFDYTNEGIDLLGVIVQRASGFPWEEYIDQNIFQKAGMNKTGLLAGYGHVEGMAEGYSLRNLDLSGWVDGPRRRVSGEDPSMRFLSKTARPAGSGYSTTGDLLKFSRALQNGTLLSSDQLDSIVHPHVMTLPLGGVERAYGYTMEIAKRDQMWYFGHGGGAPGMSTSFSVYPDQGYTVVVLSNYGNAAIHVSEHIRSFILAGSQASSMVELLKKSMDQWQKVVNEGLDPGTAYLESSYLIAEGEIVADPADHYKSVIGSNGRIVRSTLDTAVMIDPLVFYQVSTITMANGKDFKQTSILRKDKDSYYRELVLTSASTGTDCDKASIRERREEWVELCTAHDPKALVDGLYSKNAYYYNHKPMVMGQQDIAVEYSYMADPSYSLQLSPIYFQCVNDSMAFEIGQCSGSYPGKYMLIWQRFDEVWEILLDSNR